MNNRVMGYEVVVNERKLACRKMRIEYTCKHIEDDGVSYVLIAGQSPMLVSQFIPVYVVFTHQVDLYDYYRITNAYRSSSQLCISNLYSLNIFKDM